MQITAAFLAAIAGVRETPLMGELATELEAQLDPGGIVKPLEKSHFLGQMGVETWHFTRLVEDLDYQAATIAATFPKLRTRALELAHKPQALANAAYAGMDGNGDEASGDGWLCRGRGGFDITGRGNYIAVGEKLGIDLLADPDQVATPHLGVRTAIAFWNMHGLNALADADDGVEITRRITGGRSDLTERLSIKHAALKRFTQGETS